MKITRSALRIAGIVLLTGIVGYQVGRVRTQIVAQRDIAQMLGTQDYIDFVKANVSPAEFRARKIKIYMENIRRLYLTPFAWKKQADEVGSRLKQEQLKRLIPR